MLIKKMIMSFFVCLNLVIRASEQLPTNKQPKIEIYITLEEAEQLVRDLCNDPKLSPEWIEAVSHIRNFIFSKDGISAITRCVNHPEECTTKFYFVPDRILVEIDPAIKYNIFSNTIRFNLVQTLFKENAISDFQNEIKQKLEESNKSISYSALAELVEKTSLLQAKLLYSKLALYLAGKRSRD